MRPDERETARRQLDRRLNVLGKTDLKRPPYGWVKAIREALGMTGKQLAARMGLSQPRIHAIEKSEATGSIKLETLERAANALDCQLVYALVPRQPLQEIVMQRIVKDAKTHLKKTGHNMALESQSMDPEDQQEQLDQLVKKLLANAGSDIWKDS